MSNDYFTSPTDQIPLTRARAAALNNLDAAVDAAFDKVPSETNLKQGKVTYAADSGAADAYVVSLPHAPASYADGLRVDFKIGNTNTGASTINVNSLGAKTIKRLDGTALVAGDLPAAGIVTVFYNATTGYFYLTPSAMAAASAAATSATAAASSASAASSSASSAASSASAAASSATAAAASATAADSVVPRVNYLINPDGAVAQNLPASSADGDYDFDQWYAVTQTGSVASTQLSNPEDGYRYGMRMTQSQASAQRMGRCQIIEGSAASELRGKTVTFGGRRRLSTSANIRMAVLVWTGTEDSPVKDQVNDWTSSTYTTGNFFKSTTLTVAAVSSAIAMTANTARDCSVTATISSSATNIIVMEWTESTVAQNVTFDAWGARLIVASTLIDAIRRDYSEEMRLCQRYMCSIAQASSGYIASTTSAVTTTALPVTMRGSGPASVSASSYGNVSSAAAVAAASGVSLTNAYPNYVQLTWTTSGMTAGQGAAVIGGTLVFKNQIGV